ncbi:hypothetical protein RM572_00385 [Streptomyces sp. DSM 42041]|uniref:DUF2190 family protein n=1 Tax=Streptomyces hazeniae TaxID=3075538 RepID=A0ABU2NJY7_9ACTN|nr:hypothetical protein [Streptomyces sp. DSM 42041]MDT0377233.1 hypothetical protein [Streptomyces sp. DSM 42041]
MTAIIQGSQLRNLLFGNAPISKSTGTLAATTVSLFTVAGGRVAVTSLIGVVGTSITVANSYKLQVNPTTGDTSDLVAATDIGTTDTTAGTVLGFDGDPTASIVKGAGGLARPLFLPAGDIESVSAGTDGEITWYLTYVPYDDGATVEAAA